MKTSTRINIVIVAGVLLGLVAAWIVIANQASAPPAAVPTSSSDPSLAATYHDTSHRLDEAPDGKVTFVEFLDFECAVCGIAYPVVEELREEYAGRVTFVVRFFPIPSHFNGMNAAIAAEAAAQQGKFAEMYERMFETQEEWGGQQESKAAVFRGFAEELGLNLAEYDAAVADPATQARVQADFDAGIAVGVQGTPTFFVNDEYVAASSPSDLREALDRALEE